MTPLLFPLFPSAHPRCYLDMAKVLVFRYLYWFVLSVVFVTGATRISVFGLGYLLACFFFFLFGTQLLVKPARARLAVWDCLIIYNVAVIIAKNLLSVSEVLKKLQTHRTHLQTQITLMGCRLCFLCIVCGAPTASKSHSVLRSGEWMLPINHCCSANTTTGQYPL